MSEYFSYRRYVFAFLRTCKTPERVLYQPAPAVSIWPIPHWHKPAGERVPSQEMTRGKRGWREWRNIPTESLMPSRQQHGSSCTDAEDQTASGDPSSSPCGKCWFVSFLGIKRLHQEKQAERSSKSVAFLLPSWRTRNATSSPCHRPTVLFDCLIHVATSLFGFQEWTDVLTVSQLRGNSSECDIKRPSRLSTQHLTV